MFVFPPIPCRKRLYFMFSDPLLAWPYINTEHFIDLVTIKRNICNLQPVPNPSND